MFCNVTKTVHVSHADFKHFLTFCKHLSSNSAKRNLAQLLPNMRFIIQFHKCVHCLVFPKTFVHRRTVCYILHNEPVDHNPD